MRNKNRLFLLVGNIGTGKTSYVNDVLKPAKRGKLVVCRYDDIHTMLDGEYLTKNANLYYDVEKAVIQTSLQNGYNVAVHRTFHKKELIQIFRDYAKEVRCYTEIINFGINYNESIIDKMLLEHRYSAVNSKERWVSIADSMKNRIIDLTGRSYYLGLPITHVCSTNGGTY